MKNEGINGNTSADVLQRIDGIIAQQPELVLLGIGGNDVLRRVDSQTTISNINQSIEKLKQAKIPVVLIAEPHFSASALLGKASDNPIYSEIAKSHDVPLFDKEWSRILSDKNLKSDEIHANAKGYQQFAENLQQFLKGQGYLK
ncbi:MULTISPECIES: GDSL-type esterase/lipase family protein [unclassified Acinetobacter]|uniref:GDSL-type esterase/lipase family protein n=1 Tax=unclassified Acinetobacter TaxID=196816 RepID=UPI0035B8AF43